MGMHVPCGPIRQVCRQSNEIGAYGGLRKKHELWIPSDHKLAQQLDSAVVIGHTLNAFQVGTAQKASGDFNSVKLQKNFALAMRHEPTAFGPIVIRKVIVWFLVPVGNYYVNQPDSGPPGAAAVEYRTHYVNMTSQTNSNRVSNILLPQPGPNDATCRARDWLLEEANYHSKLKVFYFVGKEEQQASF